MATLLWEKEIDKTIDWGNADGLGTPVSGQYVQKFIKDTLAKKFGYLYYDRTALKYYVFADEDDYNAYASDPIGNESLLLATFDAPSPADINIIRKSLDNVTTLLTAKNRKITFNYYILDKSSNPVAENVSFRAVISRGGEQQTFTDTIKPDTTVDKTDPENTTANYADKDKGTSYTFNLDEYLVNEGTYTITITLTGLNTQASTTLTFFYTVVNLELSLDNFKYYLPFDSNATKFDIPFTVEGAAGISKVIEIYLDGEPLYQTGLGYVNAFSFGSSVGSDAKIDENLTLYNKDSHGNIVKWENGGSIMNESLWNVAKFKPGKHNLQVRVFIPGDGENFYSKTKYFEFVVLDSAATTVRETYLLYATEGEAGTIFAQNEPISLSGQQYTGISLNIAAIDSQNRKVPVKYEIVGRSVNEETGEPLFENSIEKTIENSTIDAFTYRFDDADTFDLIIKPDTSGSFTTSNEDSVNVVVTIEKFEMENENITESLPINLQVKYSALNRGNGETNKDVWVNTAESTKNLYEYPASFNKVLWNEQSGWNGEALVLKNGATVEFPIDLFQDMWDPDFGLTFEIDFETFDVQDDEAIIMDYRDVDNNGNYSIINNSYLRIAATSASLCTMKGNTLKTNFKDSTRNKIALSFNPTGEVVNGVSTGASANPNLLMIYVNGVLDRAGKWGDGTANSDKVQWGNHTVNTIKIGNEEGAAGVKIYSIRIYNRAYEPEDAFMNWVVDQGSNIPSIMKKNAIYDSSKKISLELVKAMIPTYVLYTDFTMLNNQTNKKNNTQYDAQYYDPTNPSLNFYVRNGWMSLQGTSSMQYPTKNLRPYFNKQANDKTKSYSISGSEAATALSDQGIVVAPCFNTEFWPVSEYAGHEEEVASYVDNEGIVPYLVNKKEVTKDKYFANAYHEIAQGLSKSYKIKLATNYSKSTDIYYKNGSRTFLSDGKEKTVDKYDIITATETQTVAQQITEIVNNGGNVYISAYRPLLRTGMEIGSDEYWIYIKQLRYSGVGMFTKKKKTDDNGLVGYDFSKAKKLNKDTEYYCLGAYWRQWDEDSHYSGWTDRWTFKADYAESSMCHNGGVGALWGNALRNFKLNGQALGMTQAQAASTDPYFVDIRTSCDSRPIVVFAKEPIGYDNETGRVIFGEAEFKGLYNIMTDKSSTPLFGFEDIKDDQNNVIFDASDVQCWEHLQNGSLLATGMSTAFDSAIDVTWDKAESDPDLGLNIGENRPIFTDFEPRWPESGEAKHEGDMRWFQDDVFGTESNALESFFRWVHFCKPAVNYEVNGGGDVWLSGYDLSPYVHLENLAAANAWKAANPTGKIYWKWNNSGNIAYAAEGEKYGLASEYGDNLPTFTFTGQIESDNYYWFNENINYELVRKSLNTKKIGEVWGGEVYKVPIEGFDALNHCRDAEGNINEDEASNYLVDVYMKKEGNKYYYEDSYGNDHTEYRKSAEIDADSFEVASDGLPYSQKTFMQYFSATKYDHLDVYKVAAYYIYVMRFGAVDQVVKNCMLTTEDGQHWYFINYDNDTVLGVRNDAQLIFNWDFDRDTYDYSGNSYAFAGAKSVFWNNLTADTDFMNIVKSIDAVMYSGGLLSAKTVLQYLDERQMGTWNERLYNAQEQIKYLSTFKANFETDKFLLFMQGNRSSHRNWWVNHRWELYDAMWSTGSYADKKIRFYLIVSDASNDAPREFLNITAASKYYFTVQKNNQTITDGFVELRAGESQTFYTRANIAIGDPMIIIGPQKLKVLNFRRGAKYLAATLSLNENYQVTESDGITKRNTNWVDEAGTMMSKLLLGDGVQSCPVTNLSGLNTIASLEEVDIRNCSMLTASPSVNALSNLHRFRATGSACTVFAPATGVSLYEVSLPSVAASQSGEVVKTDEQGKPIQAKDSEGNLMFEEDGVTPIYETERLTQILALQYLTLNNVNFIHQDINEYQSFQDDDMLPYTEDEEGNLGGIYTNEDAYRYTEESKAIFDCKPTIRLSNVSFNNVTGFDTKKFVMDWKAELLRNTEALDTRTLELSNINWKDITVSELIEFVKGYDKDDHKVATFTITNFTGVVQVVSDELDENENHKESITLDEYNRIIDYFGDEVFTEGNALQITTGKNIFYQPTKDTDYELVTGKYSRCGVDNVYEVIRGNVFKAKATIFPNDGVEHRYVLSGINYEVNSSTGEIMPKIHPMTGTIYVPIVNTTGSVYTNSDAGVTLVTNGDGTLTFTAQDAAAREGYNYLYILSIADVIDGVVKTPGLYDTEKNIYVATINRKVPKAADITVAIDGNTTNSINITDEEEHIVTFNLGAATNAPVESVSATISDAESAGNLVIDTTNYIVENNILTVKFNGIIPENTINNLGVTFTINFVTDKTASKTVNKTINVSLIPVYANRLEVTMGERIVTANNDFEINQTGIYRFNVKALADTEDGVFNVPIISKSIINAGEAGLNQAFIGVGDYSRYIEISEIQSDELGDFFTLTINTPSTFKSFTVAEHVTINYTDKYSAEPLLFRFDLYESIVYPDEIFLGIQDYEGDIDNYIATGSTAMSADIYLMNGQGTITGSKKLIPGQEYIDAKILAKDVFFTSTESAGYYKAPTEPYNININTESITTSSAGAANVQIITGEHGKDTIRLTINPQANTVLDVTISGNYTLSYDVDRNAATDNGVVKNESFSITLHYSVASADTYTKLTPGKYYVVDENSLYYEVPDDIEDEEKYTSDEYENSLWVANDKGIHFIGFGFVKINASTNKRKANFVMFNTDEYNVPSSKMFPRNSQSDRNLATNNSDQVTFDSSTNADEYAFPGYYMTKRMIEGYLVEESDWTTCNLYKIWNLFNNNNKIHTYIPTSYEITSMFGADDDFINKYDATLKYITIINNSYSNIEYLEYNGGNSRIAFNLTGYSTASRGHGVFNTDNDLILLFSTQMQKSDSIMISVVIDLGDGTSSSITISNYPSLWSGSSLVSAVVDENGLRPLVCLKVS